MACYTIVNLLGFVSGGFLGDALRRFYNTFKNLRGVNTNEKMMYLHLAIFLIYFVISGLKTFQFGKWFRDKNSETYKQALITYTISQWFLFIDQLVLTYLFYILGRPKMGAISLRHSNGSVSVSVTQRSSVVSNSLVDMSSETVGMPTSHKFATQGPNQYVEINKEEEGSLTNSGSSQNYAQSKQAREAARQAQDDF